MSTKTTFKRVALVAVVALGLGGLSTVPASAAITNGTVAVTSATASVAVGAAATTDFTATIAGTSAAADTIEYGIAVTKAPTDSALAVAAPAATVAATTAAKAQIVTANTVAVTNITQTTTNTSKRTDTWGAAAALSGVVRGSINVNPDVPGIYVITLTATPSAGAGNSVTFTVYAGKSLDSLRANTAFPTQGTNITSGWSAAAGGVATVRFTNFAASKVYYVTSSANINGYTERDTNNNLSQALTNGTNLAGGVTLTTGAGTVSSDALDIQLNSLVTGTQTVTVVTYDATTGVSSTFSTVSLTVGAVPAPSAQYSLLTLNTAGGTTATGAAADTTDTTVAKTAGTKRFTIQVVVNDQNNNIFNAPTLGASIAGPGQLGIANGNGGAAIAGRSVSVALTAGTGSVDVYGDGTAGEATITITATTSAGVTTTLGTKKVKFAGSPVKVVATQNLYVAKAGTALGATPSTNYLTNDGTTMALTPAFTVEVTDSNGNDVAAGSTVKMTSSDTSAITVGTCAEYVAYPGNFECSVSGATGAASGASATVTFSVYNSTTLAYDIVGNALTFKVGGAIASVTPTLDAVSYDAGQKIVLKYSAVDDKGNAAYDGQAPVSAVASNKSVGGALPAVTKYIKNGYYATSATAPTLFAPSVGGDFTISGTTIATVAAPLGAAWSLSASVTTVGDVAANAATDAANEATDAANAATDAALAAADAADAATAAAQDASDAVAALSATVAKLVASLKAQITSLTNLVIKIQKKVKA